MAKKFLNNVRLGEFLLTLQGSCVQLGIEDANGIVRVADVHGNPAEIVSNVIFVGSLDSGGDESAVTALQEALTNLSNAIT